MLHRFIACVFALVTFAATGCQAVDRDAVPAVAVAPAPAPDTYRVYIGTYTGKDSKGIYVCELDMKTGTLSEPRLAAETKSPSFLAVHPNNNWLYAVGEVSEWQGQKTGGISAFAIDAKTGTLTLLNAQSSRGTGPCHLVVDKSGSCVLVANYGGGNVAALPILEGGKLGEATGFNQHVGASVNQGRQKEPHAHSINVSPDNRFAFAADLGTDKVYVYKLDAKKGTIEPNDPPAASVAPGSGPRHFAFHPSAKFAYVINEMTQTVTAFTYDAKAGVLKDVQTISTVPAEHKGNSTAEVQVHPSGKFLYGSNRGHDTLAIYSIDQSTGKLTVVGHQPIGGKTPRNFGIDPSGQYILAAGQSSASVVVFKVDMATGKLTETGSRVTVGSPVCVKFVPVSK